MKNIVRKFDCVINFHQILVLLDQTASLRSCNIVRDRVKEGLSPNKFFSRLQDWKDGKYKLIGNLGCALLTIHGSGSSAERDFSLLNCVVGDPCKSCTGHQRKEARLSLKSYNINLKHNCEKCLSIKERNFNATVASSSKEDEEEKNNNDDDDTDEEEKAEESAPDGEEETEKVKKVHHCHCSLFDVSEGLIAEMKGGQPMRRKRAEEKEKRERVKMESILRAGRYNTSASKFKT